MPRPRRASSCRFRANRCSSSELSSPYRFPSGDSQSKLFRQPAQSQLRPQSSSKATHRGRAVGFDNVCSSSGSGLTLFQQFQFLCWYPNLGQATVQANAKVLANIDRGGLYPLNGWIAGSQFTLKLYQIVRPAFLTRHAVSRVWCPLREILAHRLLAEHFRLFAGC